MYFDFDDRYRDIEPVGSAINRRDGVALAVLLHAVIVAVLLLAPQYLPAPQQQVEVVQQPRPREEAPTFVFVQPALKCRRCVKVPVLKFPILIAALARR